MPDRPAVTTFGDTTALGRAAQPRELAAAFVYLASDDASYTVGTVIGVHGGMPMP